VVQLPHVVDPLKLIKYLTNQKGFTERKTKSGHRVFFSPDGTRRTEVPIHGRKEIHIGLLKAILMEAGIEPEEFAKEWRG
jgi:predicted RNA binding protein YcfA (HicA-like mRNA interferase family)